MVWKNPRWILHKNLTRPKTGPSQVLIKVGACGICGSDVNMYEKDVDGYIAFSSQCSFPVIIGHEFSGEIVKIGKDVKKFKVGELVTAETIRWCGTCDNCRSGNFNQCAHFTQMGFETGTDGALAEYIAVDEKYCYSLESLKEIYKTKKEIFEAGSLVEPAAVAYEGMYTVGKGFNPGEHVVVFGAGCIGLAAMQIAIAGGAAKVIVFEPIQQRRRLAKKMGADYVYNPYSADYTPVTLIKEITNGAGVGMAIEASGAPSYTLPEIEKGIAVGGKIVIVGMAAQYPRFDLMRYLRKKIHLYGALGASGSGNFSKVINLMASKRIDLRQCITDVFSLDDIIEAFDKAKSRNTGKIIIKPEN
jgi:threonine dehydrogenase-like Zn-dependent dehydrogenase